MHSRCTLHTTNHLLGSRYYSVAEFDALADELRDKLGALASGEPIGKEDFRDSEGNYDIQVMDEALSRTGLRERPNTTSVLRNWCGSEDALLDSVRLGATQAVVVRRVTGGAGQGQPRDVGAHFFCLRFHPLITHWWNLDSVLGPEMTGPSALSAHGVVSLLQQERQDHAPPKGAVLVYSIPAMEQDPHPGEDTAPALSLHQEPALGHGATENSPLPRRAAPPAADPQTSRAAA